MVPSSPQTQSQRPSRRALLAGALSGIGAVVAGTIVRPSGAKATDGQAVIQGDANSAQSLTTLTNTTTGDFGDAFKAIAHGSGIALTGVATVGWGVAGTSTGGRGVEGTTQTGIGINGTATGLGGTAMAALTSGHYSQRAVNARSIPQGIAVDASTEDGIGLKVSATGGHALNVTGRAVFDRSGVASFSAGQASRTVSGRYLSPESIVLATIQGSVSGTWVRGVSLNRTDSKFTLRLNKPAPSALKVGWFIVN